MIIGISGYAQSGKDTVAELLVTKYGFERVAFADAIRNFVYDINPKVHVGYDIVTTVKTLVDNEGWDEAKKHSEVRELLQKVGVAARNQFGEDFWVRQALSKVGYTQNTVITDVRFKNEAMSIKDKDYSQLWRVTRPGVGPINKHISEVDLDDWNRWDYEFINSGSLEDLELTISTRMNQLV